ncbi:hypothetical protein F0562_029319 [Nyssa sinensis]|uniref:Uncharacterized protein n=1 Tax=Nyssa sinensis TaxID=561372 RepID=A0A5J5B6P7_9ASTE|nr:hypothetical protein F0562_029319 [Nyssa sinensis]
MEVCPPSTLQLHGRTIFIVDSKPTVYCCSLYCVDGDGRLWIVSVPLIGHYEIFGANLDSAIPATKLNWVSSYNLLMASGTHSGPSGVLGNIKFWDLRSGNAVWELKEKVDCFADVTVSDNLSAIFKVGVNSGEVFFTDLRTVGAENSWVCLGDKRKVVNGKKEGFGCKIENHGNQVFLFCSFLFDSVKF